MITLFRAIKENWEKIREHSKIILMIVATIFLIGLLIYVAIADVPIYTVLALISLLTWILSDTSADMDVKELKDEIAALKHDIKKLKKQKYFHSKKRGKK